MTAYTLPELRRPPAAEPNTVYTVASGDLRPAANVTCWPTQEKLHRALYLHRHAGGVHRWIKDLKVASVLAKTSAQYSLGARSSVCRGLLRGRMLDSRGVCPLAGCAEHHVSSVNVEGALNCHKQQ